MSFSTILAPIKISPGNSDSLDFPAITALSNGNFAVTYDVIDYVDTTQLVSEVFNGQGQLVQETFATPLPHFAEGDPDIAGLSGGGYALAWERFVDVGGHLAPEIYTAVYDNQGNQISVPVGVDADCRRLCGDLDDRATNRGQRHRSRDL